MRAPIAATRLKNDTRYLASARHRESSCSRDFLDGDLHEICLLLYVDRHGCVHTGVRELGICPTRGKIVRNSITHSGSSWTHRRPRVGRSRTATHLRPRLDVLPNPTPAILRTPAPLPRRHGSSLSLCPSTPPRRLGHLRPLAHPPPPTRANAPWRLKRAPGAKRVPHLLAHGRRGDCDYESERAQGESVFAASLDLEPVLGGV